MKIKDNPLIVITGPTATGKTRLAAMVAYHLQGEVISADSRQVYRGMNLGTGKDLDDYLIDGLLVPYHLIDITDPGYEYNVYEYQQDFIKTYEHIIKRNRQAVLCGGSGMYIEAVLQSYDFQAVPYNAALREKLSLFTSDELTSMLAAAKPLHNTSDTSDRERLIRAIEIATHKESNKEKALTHPDIVPKVYGIHFEREVIRRRITERLRQRLDSGMVQEVEQLLLSGLKPEQLSFYGLEYKYLTLYATGEIRFDTMFEKLNTAIHQFAKRQMTWFRRMERKGIPIHWIDGNLPLEEKTEYILNTYNS